MRREIQNSQMFETDPALSPFPQQSTFSPLVMGSNKDLKIYQITNNFQLFYQIIQIIQIIF
jgi:hypothetical protein